MSTLDKSLDEIIGAGKRAPRARASRQPKKVGKQVNTRRRAPVPGRRPRAPVRAGPAPSAAVARAASLLNFTREARVTVEGLPRDIKQDAVREFFQSQVGGVQRVLLSYNERGQSTGMANVTFRNGELAKKAVAQFSGAPIDGGKSRLRLNIVVDPSIQPARPLSERIRAVSRGKPNPRGNDRNQQQQQQAKPKGPSKKAALAKARKQKPKKEKQPKKNLEDLDKEMADYFGETPAAN